MAWFLIRGLGGGLGGGWVIEWLHGLGHSGGEMLIDVVEERGVGAVGTIVGLGYLAGNYSGLRGGWVVEEWVRLQVEQVQRQQGGDEQGGGGPEECRDGVAVRTRGVERAEGVWERAPGEFAADEGVCSGLEAGDGAAHELEFGGADEAVAEVLLAGGELVGGGSGQGGIAVEGVDVEVVVEEEVAELLVGEVLCGRLFGVRHDFEVHRASGAESVERLWRARMAARAR